MGATPSVLSSAHLHHPPFFTGQMPFLSPSQQCQSTEDNNRHESEIGWRKNWGLCPFLVELGPHLTQWPGPRPTSIPSGILVHPAVWPQRTWAGNRGCAPIGQGVSGSLSNTMLPGLRPTSVPTGILMNPAIWPQ